MSVVVYARVCDIEEDRGGRAAGCPRTSHVRKAPSIFPGKRDGSGNTPQWQCLWLEEALECIGNVFVHSRS
jgi:hypothetical protein